MRKIVPRLKELEVRGSEVTARRFPGLAPVQPCSLRCLLGLVVFREVLRGGQGAALANPEI
jgi:hypothetical protein